MASRRFEPRPSGLYVPGPWRPERLSVLGTPDARGRRTYHVGEPATAAGLPTALNLVPEGSFRMPTGTGVTLYGFQGAVRSGSGGMVFDPAGDGGNGSLFIHGSYTEPNGPYVAEIDIPDIRSSSPTPLVMGNDPTGGNSTNQAAMPRSNFLQAFAPMIDAANGYGNDPYYGSGLRLGGMGLEGSYLYCTAYAYFNPDNYGNIFRRPKNLSSSAAPGWYSVLDPGFQATEGDTPASGCCAGAICEIPSSLRASFGGYSAMSGLYGAALVSRDSFGPVAFAFSPSDIGGGVAAAFAGATSFGDATTSGAGSTTLQSTAMTFSAGMVGSTIRILAGLSGPNWVDGTYTIASFTDAHHVVLNTSPTPGGAGSAGVFLIPGTDTYANWAGLWPGHTSITAKALICFPTGHPNLNFWDDAYLGTPQFIDHRSSPFTRPYSNWNEYQGGMFIEDGALLIPTAYSVGHALDDSSVDQITAYYGPSTTVWAKNGTWDYIDLQAGSPISGPDVIFSASNGNRLNCVTGTTDLTSDGTPFTAGMVGKVLKIDGGTNFYTVTFTIMSFVSASHVVIDRDPTQGLNASAGTGYVGGDTGLWAYDPSDPTGGHGPRGWPYRWRLLGVRISDMLDVYNGVKAPWDITPYTNLEFRLPFGDSKVNPIWAAYDRARRKLYIAQADVDDGNAYPIITRFAVTPAS